MPHARTLALAALALGALYAPHAVAQQPRRPTPSNLAAQQRAMVPLRSLGQLRAIARGLAAREVVRYRTRDRRDDVRFGGLASGGETTGFGSGSASPDAVEPSFEQDDLVRAHGDHLVLLQRGRLVTARLGPSGLRVLASLEAFAPGHGNATTVHELFVWEDTAVVLGAEGGSTELSLVHIDASGALTRGRSLVLNAGAYDSRRGRGAHLVGHNLVLTTQTGIYSCSGDDEARTPFRCHADLPEQSETGSAPWRPLLDGTGLYAPLLSSADPLLHLLITCDLSQPTLSCRGSGVLGPEAPLVYLSQNAAYVWQSSVDRRPLGSPTPTLHGSVLFRLPFDGSAPGAVKLSGRPLNENSFSEQGGELRVLLSARESPHDTWNNEFAGGPLRLAHVPLASFTLAAPVLPAAGYTLLLDPRTSLLGQPAPRYDSPVLRDNHFAGDYLLYSANFHVERTDNRLGRTLYVHDIARGSTMALVLPHTIARTEPLGGDALVYSVERDAQYLTTVRLGPTPTLGSDLAGFAAPRAGERPIPLFYQPTGPHSGTLALPLLAPAHVLGAAASPVGLAFFSVDDLRLARLGALEASPAGVLDDHCTVSCRGWYDNARALFYGGRTFALLGYELIEAATVPGDFRELERSSFLPASP